MTNLFNRSSAPEARIRPASMASLMIKAAVGEEQVSICVAFDGEIDCVIMQSNAGGGSFRRYQHVHRLGVAEAKSIADYRPEGGCAPGL